MPRLKRWLFLARETVHMAWRHDCLGQAKAAAYSTILFFFPLLLFVVALLSIRDVDPFLQRAFWLVVPLWFGIHIWAARLGEGIMYLAPITVIIVPLVLQGLERHLRSVEPLSVPAALGTAVPRPRASPG